MSRWEENIRKVIPYTPGEQPNQPDMIKLNTNENPYPPAPGVEKALREMDTDTMRLYPDPTAGELVHAIAKNYGLKDEQVFVGVGSDDVLAMSFLTFFNSQKPVLFPDITYYFYDVFEYQNFMKICHFGKAAEIKETVLHKTIRTIKENGLKSAFDKIIEMLWIKK